MRYFVLGVSSYKPIDRRAAPICKPDPEPHFSPHSYRIHQALHPPSRYRIHPATASIQLYSLQPGDLQIKQCGLPPLARAIFVL